jgi:hypothetical protein
VLKFAGLKTVQAANQVWEAALAHHWISFTDSFSGKRKNEQNPRRLQCAEAD